MIRIIADFLKDREEQSEKEYRRKYYIVRGELIKYFDNLAKKDLIPSWMKADAELAEWEKDGMIEKQYKKIVKYGLAV